MAITRYKKHPFSLALLLFAAILSHRAAAETLTQAVIDDYLHIDAPEVDRLATAESLGLAEVSLVVLPEGVNLAGENIFFGWPVAAMSGDTIVVAFTRKACHNTLCGICPSVNVASSGRVHIRSGDAGQTWGNVIYDESLWAPGAANPAVRMRAIGVEDSGSFVMPGNGVLLSHNSSGQSWIPIGSAFNGITQAGDLNGPRLPNHPVFGLMVFNGGQTIGGPIYIRRSTTNGISWEETTWTDPVTLPKEPAAETWGPGHILMISREFNTAFGSDGQTYAMSQHLYEYQPGDAFTDITFETKRTNIEGNLWAEGSLNGGKWANDTGDVIYNPVTGRLEVLQSHRFGGGFGYDGNNSEIPMSTLVLWSIDPDDLLAGSSTWRYEGTLLKRNDYHGQCGHLDGLHPGGSVIDSARGVQHIYLYAGGGEGTKNGLFQITRSLDTPRVSAFLKESLPNRLYTGKWQIDTTELLGDLANPYFMVKLEPASFDYSQFRSNHADIYFTGTNQVAQPHTTLRWNPAGTSLLLARIPMLRVGETGQLFMHWGDQQAYFRERDDGLDPGLSSFSVSFWFKSKSSSDFYYVVHKGSELGGLEPGWAILRHSAGLGNGLRFRVQDDASILTGSFTDTTSWHHVVGVIDRGSDLLRLYVDGVSQGTANIGAVGSISSPDALTIADPAYADVEDLMIVRTAFSSGDVQAIYQAGRQTLLTATFTQLPLVSIQRNVHAVSESSGSVSAFTISRAGDTCGDIDVYYQIEGTADNGTDYTQIADKVTIPDGQQGVSLVLQPQPDGTQEGNETVMLSLMEGEDYNLEPATQASVTINDTCSSVMVSDANLDCRIDLVDFSMLAKLWPDGADSTDLIPLVEEWLLDTTPGN